MPAAWRDDALAEKWRKVRTVRRVVTGALEIERAHKRIGSSLEADPFVYVSDPDLFAALVDIDLAEVVHHLGGDAGRGRRPAGSVPARRRAGRRGRGAARRRARNARARGKSSPSVGSDPAYPDVSPRDAQALREWDTMRKAAE